MGAAAGQEDRRWIGDLLQALVAHREHAQFVDRTEAVLERAQQAEAAAARPRNTALHRPCARARAGRRCRPLVTWPTRNTAVPVSLANRTSRAALAHLADRTGRGGQALGPQGLHGVGHDQPRAGLGRMLQDRFDPGLGQCVDPVQRQLQAVRAAGDLRQRFLAGDVQHRQFGRHSPPPAAAGSTCRCPDRHRPAPPRLDQATAQHPVELADAGGDPAMLGLLHVLQGGDLRRVDLAGPAGRRAKPALGRRRAFQHDFRQRVPGVALGALARHLLNSAPHSLQT